jgi:hypothetical protein
LRPTRKRSWPPLVRSVRAYDGAAPLTGFVLCALAFSTLLSSQGAGAHLRRALTLLQGNHMTLPGSIPLVNSVRWNFANSWTCPYLQGSLSRRPARTARGPSYKDFLVAPRDLPLSRPSPRGKKNSRGAPRLRQIERGNLSLTQVRRDVSVSAQTVAVGRSGETRGEGPASKRGRSAQTMGSAQTMAGTSFRTNAGDGHEPGLSPHYTMVKPQVHLARRGSWTSMICPDASAASSRRRMPAGSYAPVTLWTWSLGITSTAPTVRLPRRRIR